MADIGGHEQYVGVQRLGEDGAGQVLVDDGFDALQLATFVADDGDAAPAGAHDDGATLEQESDQPGLHDPLRPRRADDAAPPGPVRLDHPASLGSQPRRIIAGVHLAHELGGIGEGRVGRLDERLVDDGGHLPPGQAVLHRLEQPVADHPLRLRAEDVERVRRREVRVRGTLQRQHTDLGAVAVGDDELVLRRERCQRLDGASYVRFLHLGIGPLPALEQRVPAEGDHDPHVSRPGWPRARP